MHMKKIRYVFIAAMTVIAMSCAKESLTVENESQSYSDAGGLESVAGEVVVKFDESLSDILDRLTASGRVQTRSSVTSIDRVLDLIDGYEIERVFPVDPSVEEQTRAAGLHLWYVVRFGEGHTVDEVIEKLSELGEVQDASPVRTIKRAYNAGKKAIPLSPKMMGSSSRVLTKADGMPFDDELLKYQWHLLNNGWTADYVLESGYDDIVFDQDAAKAKFEVGADVNVAPAWKKGIQGDSARYSQATRLPLRCSWSRPSNTRPTTEPSSSSAAGGIFPARPTCSTGEGAASLPKRSGQKHARWKSLSSTISCTTQARVPAMRRAHRAISTVPQAR